MQVLYNNNNVLFCDGIRFIPGFNEVKESVLQKLIRNPLFKYRVDKGIIVIPKMENFSLEEEKPVSTKEEESKKIDCINNSISQDSVKKMTHKEKNSKVMEAAEERIEKIKVVEKERVKKFNPLKDLEITEPTKENGFTATVGASLMAATNQEIIDMLFVIAPQFKTDDPEKLAQYNALIDGLKCFICEDIFGKCYTIAFAYLLAHMLFLSVAGPLIGGASSLSEGGLSIAFGTNGGSLSNTVYGRQYLMFLNQVTVSRAFVTGRMGCCGYGMPFQQNFGSGWIRPWPNGGCC